MDCEEIRLAIKGRIDKIIQEEIEQAQIRARKRMLESITAISLDICEWYSVQDMGTHLEVRVSKKGKGE